jgi:hypothetical protein
MSRPLISSAVVVAVVLPSLAGCQLERLFPEEVGAGAARLTVLNAGALAKALDDDTGCGFSSPSGKASYVVDGEVGQTGTVTWRIERCVLDFGEPHVVLTDCNGVERSIGGRATVTGTRTVRGVITGNPDTPVVPLSADAAHMNFTADVVDFVVSQSSSANAGTIRSGQLTFDAEVHLAESASLGVCAIDTSEVTIQKLTLTDARYTIDSEGRVFDVDVPKADLFAQLGAWGPHENFIDGAITVWDVDVDVGADPVLDPDYDRDTFRDSYACKADLKVPQNYTCPDLATTVVNGSTRLLLNDVGNLVQAAVADTTCGFASPAVLNNARVEGVVGRPDGEALLSIDTPCTIDIPRDTVLARDCNGVATVVGGRATIRGTMRQRGRLTGDVAQPVVPESRDAVEIVFDVTFDGWSVATTTGDRLVDGARFEATSGGVTGRMRPRLAKDTLTGACSAPTPVVAFDDIVVRSGTTGQLHNDGLAMTVTFQEGHLSATAGDRGDVENAIDGAVVVDVFDETGKQVDVSGRLDPEYDPATAASALACKAHVEIPASDDDCDFAPVLAENAARLTIQTAGTLAMMINKDDQCGFEDQLGVLIWPTEVQGNNGEMGSMTWDIADCSIDTPWTEVLSEDCTGGVTWVEGNADFVDVGRTVRGQREKIFLGLFIDSVVPRENAAVDVYLRQVELRDFATYLVPDGASEPEGILVIHEGTLSAIVQPALGARADDPSVVDVPTPVAMMSSVHLTADATLYAQGKTFHFSIDDTDLQATNGRFFGEENALAGTVVLDGETHDLGRVALNPNYTASSFDDSYRCTENLAAPLR